MKTLKERVIEQIEAEYPVGDDGAHEKLRQMDNCTLLSHISLQIDEMFKEQWDQDRNAIISSAR